MQTKTLQERISTQTKGFRKRLRSWKQTARHELENLTINNSERDQGISKTRSKLQRTKLQRTRESQKRFEAGAKGSKGTRKEPERFSRRSKTVRKELENFRRRSKPFESNEGIYSRLVKTRSKRLARNSKGTRAFHSWKGANCFKATDLWNWKQRAIR